MIIMTAILNHAAIVFFIVLTLLFFYRADRQAVHQMLLHKHRRQQYRQNGYDTAACHLAPLCQFLLAVQCGQLKRNRKIPRTLNEDDTVQILVNSKCSI